MEKEKSRTSKKAGAAETSHPRERYEFWYENMLLIRRFEEKAGQLYGQQKIKGFCHLYIGQEACASGAVSASIKDDKWITAYRDHGLPLALGSDPKALMAEMFAKATGCSKGKGGSMHFFDKSVTLWVDTALSEPRFQWVQGLLFRKSTIRPEVFVIVIWAMVLSVRAHFTKPSTWQ
jgi:TPP-dependent pyruvate/acetoin dehydrogenase alpha subunit